MIGTLKTDDALIKRLEESAKKPITKEELTRQRISFVYGNLPDKSTITRARVAEKIKRNEGESGTNHSKVLSCVITRSLCNIIRMMK